MRAVLFAYFVTGIFFMALFWGFSNGQYFEDPTMYFKKFEFDWMNRGTFNISTCMKDLMTCYELVKPDAICSNFRTYETVCPLTREVCHDYYGDFDTYGYQFNLFETSCYYKGKRNQQYT